MVTFQKKKGGRVCKIMMHTRMSWDDGGKKEKKKKNVFHYSVFVLVPALHE